MIHFVLFAEKNIILMYFKKWTRDRSGSISAREMKSVFRALGIQASDHEIISVVDKMDVDGMKITLMKINSSQLTVGFFSLTR